MIFVLSVWFLVFGTLMHHLLSLGEPVHNTEKNTIKSCRRPSNCSEEYLFIFLFFFLIKKTQTVTSVNTGLRYRDPWKNNLKKKKNNSICQYLPKAHILGITLLPTFQGINRIFLGYYFASFLHSFCFETTSTLPPSTQILPILQGLTQMLLLPSSSKSVLLNQGNFALQEMLGDVWKYFCSSQQRDGGNTPGIW